MRRPIIAGNWKMNKTVAEARDLVEQIIRELDDLKGVDIVLCPPFTTLAAVSEAMSGNVSRLHSASVAKVGKMLRLHASQQRPSSHRRPSVSGRSLWEESSKM